MTKLSLFVKLCVVCLVEDDKAGKRPTGSDMGTAEHGGGLHQEAESDH